MGWCTVYQNSVIQSGISTGSLDSLSKGGDFLALYFMSEFYIFYICMALAGSILSWFQVYIPVRNKLIEDGDLSHPYIANNYVTTAVWLVAAAVLVPFLVSALLFENKRSLFIQAVYEGAK